MSTIFDTSPPSPRPPVLDRLVVWAVGPMFLGLAAWFAFSSPTADIPLNPPELVARDRFTPGARRHPMGNPPTAMIGGFAHKCNECHVLFQSPPVERRVLTQHTTIRFDHGMNNRCFNCHDRRDRERLVLHDGATIGFDEVPRLCSQCHGTVFRDWQQGVHGKTMGSWDASSGRQHRLNCNDCHDPHAPAYPRIAPLPAPNTLRMGDQSEQGGDEEHGQHTPLRQRPASGHHDANHAEPATLQPPPRGTTPGGGNP